MSRKRAQIDADARIAAEVVRTAGRALRVYELAEGMRERGVAQTYMQAHSTTKRALELGLLRSRDGRHWDLAVDEESADGVGMDATAGLRPARLLIHCARRLLELPPTPSINQTARRILDEASGRLPLVYEPALDVPQPHPDLSSKEGVAASYRQGPSNGGTQDANQAVEVLLSSLS